MRCTQSRRGDDRRAALALAAALILAGGWWGTTVKPADAAFPGQNGRIAFVSDRVTPGNPQGDAEIYTMAADGANQTWRTNHPGSDQAHAWSPTAELVAFESRTVPRRRGRRPMLVRPANRTGRTASQPRQRCQRNDADER